MRWEAGCFSSRRSGSGCESESDEHEVSACRGNENICTTKMVHYLCISIKTYLHNCLRRASRVVGTPGGCLVLLQTWDDRWPDPSDGE